MEPLLSDVQLRNANGIAMVHNQMARNNPVWLCEFSRGWKQSASSPTRVSVDAQIV